MQRFTKFCSHLAVVFIAFIIAYELRRGVSLDWWLNSPQATRVWAWAALYAAIAGVAEAIFKTERSAWRFTSARDLIALLRSCAVTALVFTLFVFVTDRGFALPRSILILAPGISFGLFLGIRLGWRLAFDRTLVNPFLPTWWRSNDDPRKRLVVVGSMAEAEPHVRHLLADPAGRHRPAIIVSPVQREQGLQLHGVPCYAGVQRLESIVEAHFGKTTPAPAILFLQDPVAALDFSAERIGQLLVAGHTLLRLQPMIGPDREGASIEALQEISLEEFLPRAPVKLDPSPIMSLVAGRRVLVTGAGGSIGSELARQLAALRCSHLTLVDHSEFLLFEIDRELAGLHPQLSRRALLVNVRDVSRVQDVMNEERPDLVFHAAALKHVSLVENNPAEGVMTNVVGTWNTMTAAINAGAHQFVLISTDKAVAPTNVMGATKRIAETLLHLAPEGRTLLSAVRFGNVLGSAGSVVPIFRDQIARGGPVTVTHPDVNRFFMTIPEAVQLVLHSTAIRADQATTSPTKFLLEMGVPVKIVDLARQMIELSGKRPEIDVRIEFTGLKPGEKLTETLVDEGEQVVSTAHGIMQVQSTAHYRLNVGEVQRLATIAQTRPAAEVRSVVREILEICCRDK